MPQQRLNYASSPNFVLPIGICIEILDYRIYRVNKEAGSQLQASLGVCPHHAIRPPCNTCAWNKDARS
jgi:hypothetical protein